VPVTTSKVVAVPAIDDDQVVSWVSLGGGNRVGDPVRPDFMGIAVANAESGLGPGLQQKGSW